MKTLRGVAHDIAHHAQSGLAFLYPHLGAACREAGVLETSVELLTEGPYPDGLPRHEPLALALTSVRARFFEILAAYGFAASEVSRVELSFVFPERHGDGSIYSVRALVVATNGREYEAIVG
jgi:hypothetical protein